MVTPKHRIGALLVTGAVVAAGAAPGVPELGSAAESLAGKPAEAATSAKQGPVLRAERRIRRCANVRRSKNGVRRVRTARKLNRAARLHARNMARHGFFDHTDHRGRSPYDRVGIFDRGHRIFSSVGENIAAGYGSVRAACRGWMKSGGHRANILERGWTHIGAGFARGGPYGRYYVQVFARKR